MNNNNHHLEQQPLVDVIGLGIGPFNLSLAALLWKNKKIKNIFFDRKESFTWHPGMLFNDAEIQVNHLKDLVTLVDPTNPYSFIAYLAKHKRLYRFINSRFKHVLRKEFNQYFNWVSQSIPNLFFNENVLHVEHKNYFFNIVTTKRETRSQHIVLGSGLTPYLPPCAKIYQGKEVYHNADFLHHKTNWLNKRVVVIGGGQSGAEIVYHILSNSNNLPDHLTWITKRPEFAPIDDSPFVNEYFTPTYNQYFYRLEKNKKTQLLNEQTLASDGISGSLLEAIYRQLYELELVDQRGKFFELLTSQQLINIQPDHGSKKITIADCESKKQTFITADIIILCTGYRWEFPQYLAPLKDRITLENNHLKVNQDFSIEWDGPQQNRIYVQNAARHSHGVADPNLSLMAYRSATIINSIAEEKIYDLEDESTTIEWFVNYHNKKENLKYASNL